MDKYTMSLKRFTYAVVLLLLVSGTTTIPERPGTTRPNILVIISCDQSYHTVHALSHEKISTPNLDSLASAGVAFTHAFNMGSWQGAVCNASRDMMLTGYPLWQAQQADMQMEKIITSEGTWINHLRTAGYETYLAGKWPGNIPKQLLFDHVLEGTGNGPQQNPAGYNRPQSPTDTSWTPWNKNFGGFWNDNKHATEVLADHAIEALTKRTTRDKPFLMYLAFHAPHDPRQAPKEFVEKYPVDEIKVPENFLPFYPYAEQIGCGPDARDEKLAPFPRTAYAIKKNIQEYYATISHMDAQLGRVFKTLMKTGDASNTYIFFASDNGLAVGQHGLMGKQNMFDHSVRVPLLLAGPGVPSRQSRHQLVYVQDVMATAYALTGLPQPDDVYFKSLMPVVHDRDAIHYPEVYGGYIDLQRMVRTERYKLIVYPRVSKVLLFDLEKDPYEIRDVSTAPVYKKILTDLKKRLRKQQHHVGDTLDLSWM